MISNIIEESNEAHQHILCEAVLAYVSGIFLHCLQFFCFSARLQTTPPNLAPLTGILSGSNLIALSSALPNNVRTIF